MKGQKCVYGFLKFKLTRYVKNTFLLISILSNYFNCKPGNAAEKDYN